MPKEVGPGWIRTLIPFHLTGANLSGTGATVVINALALGFRGVVEKIQMYTVDTLAGASGSQTFVVRKGSTTGTALATAILTVADHATMGTKLSTAVAVADDDEARFTDTDTISLTRTTGGTAISSGSVDGYIVIRQRPQARI